MVNGDIMSDFPLHCRSIPAIIRDEEGYAVGNR